MQISNACLSYAATLMSLFYILDEELQRQGQHHVTFYATDWAKMSRLLKGT